MVYVVLAPNSNDPAVNVGDEDGVVVVVVELVLVDDVELVVVDIVVVPTPVVVVVVAAVVAGGGGGTKTIGAAAVVVVVTMAVDVVVTGALVVVVGAEEAMVRGRAKAARERAKRDDEVGPALCTTSVNITVRTDAAGAATTVMWAEYRPSRHDLVGLWENMTSTEPADTSFSWQVVAPRTRALTVARPPPADRTAGVIFTGPIETCVAVLADAVIEGTRPMAPIRTAANRVNSELLTGVLRSILGDFMFRLFSREPRPKSKLVT